MKGFALAAILLLTACTQVGQASQPVAGWSASGNVSPSLEAQGWTRFVISGRPEAVDEFIREATADGWILEARAPASAEFVLVQLKGPYRPGRISSFVDRYLTESPRRLNVGHIVSAAETR